MGANTDLFAALAAPFAAQEVKTRSQAGRQFAYVTARTVMNRLDAVLSPENWWDEYIPNANSVLCRLSIRLPDGQVLTKADAGGYAGMADQGDDDKSGYSDAFKRAAVKFGVGRYLYGDGVPDFAKDDHGRELERRAEPPRNGSSNGRQGGGNGPPRTGKALFAWAAKAKENTGLDVVGWLGEWGRSNRVGDRVTQFPDAAIADAYAAACDWINANLAAAEGGDDDSIPF